MRTLGILVNTQKPLAIQKAKHILSWGKTRGIQLLLPPHEASVLGVEGVSDEIWRTTVEAGIVIGGDGTFLRASRYVLDHGVPLYGINLGNMGFLASGKPEEFESDLERILSGLFEIEPHHVLEGAVWREDLRLHTMFALNDLVVSKGAFARLVTIEIRFASEFVSHIAADGIIVATPTGSTAYALSAGGPIVPPHVPCMVIAPICAHTLYTRPVIAGEQDVISLISRGSPRDVMLTQDGQLGYELLPGDRIEVSLSKDKHVRMIVLPHRRFFSLVQEKFRWGAGVVLYEKE